MLKDKWIWQGRKVDVPWTIYVVKVYEVPQRFDSTFLDVSIYSEDIDNADHELSYVDVMGNTLSSVIDFIGGEISKFANFTQEDRLQVESAIYKLMLDC